MSLLRIVIALLLLGVASPAGVSAQADPIVATESVAQAPDSASERTAVSSGLPQRPPDPRTLHDFWPVFAGFAVTWIGMTAYLLTFSGKLKRLGDAAIATTGKKRGADV